jgi:phosphotransferase system enzyme I (PtsI)
MAPTALAAVRVSLAAHTAADCARLAELALAAPDAGEARRLVAAAASPVGGGE